ncbi:MAG: GatB/YqeY domain-containing protein [Bacilli bacterium]|nr:GatB/YqeY domain-containing protein [Bacilli bacterium]MDY6392923.1 GatB/YqeY domain-containing protein [Bacilli bacterium]
MLIDDIKKASLQAMKDHNPDARTSLSMVISRYQALLTSGKGETPTDKDVIAILIKFSKELEEERAGYVAAGREESVASLTRQIEAVAAFLPKLMSEEEIKAVILSLEDRSIPSVMRYFKANYEGKADMGLVSKLARSLQ